MVAFCIADYRVLIDRYSPPPSVLTAESLAARDYVREKEASLKSSSWSPSTYMRNKQYILEDINEEYDEEEDENTGG